MIIYSTSLPVVLYLVTLLHRVCSVSMWLVAVMRQQGGDGVFLPFLESDLGTGGQSVYLPHDRISTISPGGAVSLQMQR